MKLAYLRSRQRSHRNRPGRIGCALASATLLTTCLVLAAPGAGAAPITTSGLTRVTVSSYQALPPPYKPGRAVLKSASSLRTFENNLRADHIGTSSHPTTSTGCTGGTQYTVALTYTRGRHASLDAYDCGGSVTGNMTGNVTKFVSYLSGLMT